MPTVTLSGLQKSNNEQIGVFSYLATGTLKAPAKPAGYEVYRNARSSFFVDIGESRIASEGSVPVLLEGKSTEIVDEIFASTNFDLEFVRKRKSPFSRGV